MRVLLDEGGQVAWARASLARAAKAGGGRVPAAWLKTADESVLDRPAVWRDALAVLGFLSAWGAASVSQLERATGVRMAGDLTRPPALLRTLFALGLVEVGQVRSLFSGGGELLVRPGSQAAFDRLVAPRATYSEWLGVSGGRPFRFHHRADRHNLLAVEFALRACEVAEVAGALGERDCVARGLARPWEFTGVGAGSVRQADGCLVRFDGVKVAFELTASDTPRLAEKVLEWARLLASSPWEDSGLLVVFVHAGTLATRDAVASSLRGAVRRAVRIHPQASSRLGVVGLAEFLDDEALAPGLGVEVAGEDAWERAWWGDALTTPAPVGADVTFARVSGLLGGTPLAARRRAPSPLELSPLVCASAGVRPDAHPPSRLRRAVGAASGAAGAALTPARLEWARTL